MNRRDTFNTISEKWYPELHYAHPKVPIIVVGLRWDKDSTLNLTDTPVNTQEALDICKKINASAYIESTITTPSDAVNVYNVAVTTGISAALKQNGITVHSNHLMNHLVGPIKYFNMPTKKGRLSNLLTSIFNTKPDNTVELEL
jgi:GTPase SAR1 family protein